MDYTSFRLISWCRKLYFIRIVDDINFGITILVKFCFHVDFAIPG